jgi:hypothetical protein
LDLHFLTLPGKGDTGDALNLGDTGDALNLLT